MKNNNQRMKLNKFKKKLISKNYQVKSQTSMRKTNISVNNYL